MALNGIDAQIMIQRTADYSKDVGNNVRKSELMQEYASTMRKAEEQVKASTVTRQEAPDKVRFSVKRTASRKMHPLRTIEATVTGKNARTNRNRQKWRRYNR